MKKKYYYLFIIIFYTSVYFAQDVITKKSGEDIKAKVLEVTTTEIKFNKFDMMFLKFYFHKRHNLASPDRSGNPGIAKKEKWFDIVSCLAMADCNGWQE